MSDTASPSNPPAPAPAPAATPPPAHEKIVHEVLFVAYPKLLFVWPIIVAGLLLWPFAPPSAEHSPQLETVGWIYITLMLIVVLTLGVDVNRNQAVFWAVLIFALWILGMYLKAVQNIPVFGWILSAFANMEVQYNRSFGLALSCVLAIPFAAMMLWARINDRWRITHNEFEHFSFGRLDDSLGRGAKTIRTEFPDVFEMLLGMAGTMIVFNASGTQELRRIPHVMFLPLIRSRLNQVLERVAVTTATSTDEEEEGAGV